ncbi:MAG: hypothetical protein NTW21_16215 [Verrucomicrobia bacterium]|nr:hypothetical protein [Verrucomicrobiota bacterium]
MPPGSSGANRISINHDDGSGIHILVYRLSDGTWITVGTPDKNKLMYIEHADKCQLIFRRDQALWTYAQGDPADLYTSAASPPVPGCGPLPRPNPPARKPR